uniref:Uncharacterized protein n=1 Tax=Seriola lalandi dorsalis TaxID=1841481 RepID=A0A3B4XDC2_SERLL
MIFFFLLSPLENTNIKQGCDVGAAKASCSPSTEDAAEFKDNSCISKEESFCDSSDSDDPYADSVADGEEECKDTRKSRVKLKQVENEPGPAFPEPRLPFPCMSTLSSKDQKTYLGFLMRKKSSDPPQNLKGRVNNEVIQFMRYLQAVAKMCADDYNFISQGAMQYSEDFFRGCLECIKTFPQFYQIHEMTSLTGGTFNPGLNLTFEKQLLIMVMSIVTPFQLLQFSQKTPEGVHNISRDGNAEKLCARYEPHVCLTRDALVKLLDNHGPDFGEPWELPVWIKVNPEKGTATPFSHSGCHGRD